MALLNAAARKEVRDTLMREYAADWEPCAGTKADLEALIAAADQFQDDNAAAFNTSIPVGPRGTFTAAQKSRAFSAVARRRWGG